MVLKFYYINAVSRIKEMNPLFLQEIIPFIFFPPEHKTIILATNGILQSLLGESDKITHFELLDIT